MGFLKPTDSVHKMISLPRWQRDFYFAHPNIKLAPLVQEKITIPLISEKDPEYLKKFLGKKIEIDFEKPKTI